MSDTPDPNVQKRLVNEYISMRPQDRDSWMKRLFLLQIGQFGVSYTFWDLISSALIDNHAKIITLVLLQGSNILCLLARLGSSFCTALWFMCFIFFSYMLSSVFYFLKTYTTDVKDLVNSVLANIRITSQQFEEFFTLLKRQTTIEAYSSPFQFISNAYDQMKTVIGYVANKRNAIEFQLPTELKFIEPLLSSLLNNLQNVKEPSTLPVISAISMFAYTIPMELKSEDIQPFLPYIEYSRGRTPESSTDLILYSEEILNKDITFFEPYFDLISKGQDIILDSLEDKFLTLVEGTPSESDIKSLFSLTRNNFRNTMESTNIAFSVFERKRAYAESGLILPTSRYGPATLLPGVRDVLKITSRYDEGIEKAVLTINTIGNLFILLYIFLAILVVVRNLARFR
jgi:hypothetical protein